MLYLRNINLTLICLAVCLFVSVVVQGQDSEVLSDFKLITELTDDQAESGVKVEFEAFMTTVAARRALMTFQQDQVSLRGFGAEDIDDSDLSGGTRVRVVGTTMKDVVGLAIRVEKLEVLEEEVWPDPVVPSRELSDESYRSLFVEVEGIVQREWNYGGRRTMDLSFRGEQIRVSLPLDEVTETDEELMDARVRVRAVVIRNHLTGGYRRVLLGGLHGEHFEILAKGRSEEEIEMLSVAKIHRNREQLDSGNRVRFKGIVSGVVSEHSITLYDDGASVRVWLIEKHEFDEGDLVSGVGFIGGRPALAFIHGAELQKNGVGVLPEPIDLASMRSLDPITHNSNKLRIKGNVLDQAASRERDTMALSVDGRVVHVELSKEDGGEGMEKLQTGSVVEVTGRADVLTDDDGMVTGLAMRLDLPSGVELLELPSAWTKERMFKVAGGFAGLAMVIFGWSWLLRRRVREQTSELKERFALEHQLERRYSLLVEHANDLVWTLDLSGEVRSVNGAVERTLGLGSEQLIGSPFEDVVYESYRIEVRKHLSEHREGDSSSTFEAVLICVDERKVEVSSRLVPGEDGADVILAVARDITERQKSARRLVEQDAFYRQVIDSLPNMVFVKDRDGRFALVNQIDAEYFGKSCADEMIGLTDYDVIPDKEQVKSIIEDDQEVLRTGREKFIPEEPVTCADGSLRWFQTTKRGVRDSKGRITHLVGVATEITERKEAESMVKDSEALYHSLVENLSVGVFRKDLDGRFLFCNTVHKKMHHRDLTGLTVKAIMSEEEVVATEEVDKRILRTGENYEITTDYKFQHSEKRSFVHIVKSPFRNADGEIVGIQGMVWDVTEKHEAQEKMQHLNRELVEASRFAGMAEVATGVLHNVGNVLNSVNVSATLVSDRIRQSKVLRIHQLAAMLKAHEEDLVVFLSTDPKGRQIPKYIYELSSYLEGEHRMLLGELGQLTKYVEHIKEIVAMQQSYACTGGMTENLDPRDIAEDAIAMNLAGLDRHKVNLIRNYSDTPEVVGDKHKILQILVNLIGNAKYAVGDSTSGERKITVGIFSEGNQIAMAVADTGMGISSENLTKIFSHGFTTKSNGHGFGLHSGALAAKEMNGTLTVASEGPGEGAVFTLFLPASGKAPTDHFTKDDVVSVSEIGVKEMVGLAD